MNAATEETSVADAAVSQQESQSLFVTVPAVTLPNGVTVPSFQVGQYFCSKGAAGVAVSASATPWVDISYFAAVDACKAAGLSLLTELQALAIAHDIANQAINWTAGAVGVGSLKQGLRNFSVTRAQAGDFVPMDPDEDRWFVLSNGSRICDAAGNIYSWIFDDVQGDERGLVAKTFADDSPSIAAAPYPSMDRGMGWRPKAGTDWSSHALARGGCWRSESRAGVFCLRSVWPDDEFDYVGFRCTKQ